MKILINEGYLPVYSPGRIQINNIDLALSKIQNLINNRKKI